MGRAPPFPKKISLLLFQRLHCQPSKKGKLSWDCKEVSCCAILNTDDFFFPTHKKRLQENHIPWLWQVFLLSWSWLHRRLLYTLHSHRCPLWDREAHQWPGTENNWVLITSHWQYSCHGLTSFSGQSITNNPIKLSICVSLQEKHRTQH